MMVFHDFIWKIGTRAIAEKLVFFHGIIARLEEIYGFRPFDQQSAQSLLELWLLVRSIRPRTVFELGTGKRSSTLALAHAAAELADCTVRGLDLAPIDFARFAQGHFPDVRFGPVIDTAAEATTFEIPVEWPRPIVMLYDAHDHGVPGKIISRHAIAHWFPRLRGETVAIHDCAVIEEGGPDGYPAEAVRARHWSGRTVAGYPEVEWLIDWMNTRRVGFWRPGDELKQFGLAAENSYLIALTIPPID